MPDFIEVYDDVLSPELCSAIASQFASSEATQAGVTGSGVDPAWKQSEDICITRFPEWREIEQAVMSIAVRYLLQYMHTYPHLLTSVVATGRDDPQTGQWREFTPEDLNAELARKLLQRVFRPTEILATHYPQAVGGYHRWHSEIYPREPDCETLHRVLLFMFYINTVAEGGETEFFYYDRKIAPRAGRMVVAPAGFTHTHKGHIPVSDDKLILTSWLMFNRAENVL